MLLISTTDLSPKPLINGRQQRMQRLNGSNVYPQLPPLPHRIPQDNLHLHLLPALVIRAHAAPNRRHAQDPPDELVDQTILHRHAQRPGHVDDLLHDLSRHGRRGVGGGEPAVRVHERQRRQRVPRRVPHHLFPSLHLDVGHRLEGGAAGREEGSEAVEALLLLLRGAGGVGEQADLHVFGLCVRDDARLGLSHAAPRLNTLGQYIHAFTSHDAPQHQLPSDLRGTYHAGYDGG